MNTSVGPSPEKVPDVAPSEKGGRDLATKIHGPPPEAPSGAGVEPRYFWAISALLWVIALLKAARVPSLWAASHLTINYSHGFVRRGLVGEILWLLGGGRFFKYNTLAFLAALISVTAGALLVVTLRRLFRADARDAALQGAVCAFLASPGLVFFVHMIGYFDYIGLVMSFGFVLGLTHMKRIYVPFFVAAPIGVVMALVHEALVAMFFPRRLTLSGSIPRGGGQRQHCPPSAASRRYGCFLRMAAPIPHCTEFRRHPYPSWPPR
jgi:hypothetical protein